MRWAFAIDSVPFSLAVRDGLASLGGSESACLGLGRALAARGHTVHFFATKLAADAEGLDAHGCFWHAYEELAMCSAMFHWDVFVALRQPAMLNRPVRARYRILWNQDLLIGEQVKHLVMSTAWNLDAVAYVSAFHRRQWEDQIPEIASLGWATRNGYDPALVPTDAVKDPNRIIHISRPERALEPLLEMWPVFKQAHPHAELHLCRYASMYDGEGSNVRQMVLACDEAVRRVHAKVGGITYLGELGKADLYRAIASSAVMWYPGVPTFAETSCIAAIEAQACGTPFVGSFKGALPETVPSGVLVKGDAFTPEYQHGSMAAVSALMDECRQQSVAYRKVQAQGRAHVTHYTYAALAAEWEAKVLDAFDARVAENPLGVLRALMHEDDLMSAQVLARGIADPAADEALALIDDVIAGKTHTPDNYGDHSLSTKAEIEMGGRIPLVVDQLQGAKRILDLACGNGAFAISLALADPERHVTAIDFSPVNIEKATAAAAEYGVSDRITFICDAVWDFETQQPAPWLDTEIDAGPQYDGLWIGEFIEHIAECARFIDAAEQVCLPGAKIRLTCPSGPLTECLPRNIPLMRSHVHHFTHDDLIAVWGEKQDVGFQYLRTTDLSPSGSLVGGWLIGYTASGAPTGTRPYAERIRKTRPRLSLTVGVLAHNAEYDLGRCLDSIWYVADEILIANTGSRDNTRQIAETFGRKVRVIDLPTVQEFEDGFAGARNAVLKESTGDWFLWMDTDEVMVGSQALRAYLETGGPFHGFALKQNHLQLDAPFHFDTPVRIFRTSQPIQFYGCVHEQPQLGDCNTEITPALQLDEVQLAHFGYLVSGIREQKAYTRNRPLLLRDGQRFPARRLGKVLWLRQLVQDADELTRRYGPTHPGIATLRQKAVDLFRAEFSDPADKYHGLARPFYEGALMGLGQFYEVERSLFGQPGSLNGKRAKPTRLVVADAEELQRVLEHEAKQAAMKLRPPTAHVDPYVDEPVHTEAVSV